MKVDKGEVFSEMRFFLSNNLENALKSDDPIKLLTKSKEEGTRELSSNC